MDSQLDKHIIAAAPNDVVDICQPLFCQYDIKIFVHSRVYQDGQYWTLTNNTGWIEYFYQQKYIVPNRNLLSGFYIDLDEIGIPEQQIANAKNIFNLSNWLNIIESNDQYYDVFGFATEPSNRKIYNRYLNEKHIFEYFVKYFKTKARRLIKQADKSRIKLPELKTIKIDSIKEIQKNKNSTIFSANLKANKYFLNDKDDTKYFTQREYECIYFASLGKTFKEIGNALGVTESTVKKYLEHAKNRLGCFNKSQLIEIFMSSNKF
jgi:DNA-binding CsgD family transcriptional regulator